MYSVIKLRVFFVFCIVCWYSAAFSQNALKTPNQFLPHRLGEHFTPHYLLTGYFEYLAGNAQRTMKLERYGRTNEGRPLQIAIFSSPANMARLEQIRSDNLRLAGLEPGAAETTASVAVVWLSMSVHGNEPSGSECSMELAYQLAAQTDPQIREWLNNTVVIVDPSLNPDGYDRYTHWNRMASNRWTNANGEAREHREPWPGGRTNHYYFDLNRDWAWGTQVETRQRLAIYHRWLPHIHADLHEQGIDNPYYFAPAAEPTHAFVTTWQRDFQVDIGKNHARYFDQNGWLYFTKEVFDLLYPSYGDTYPMFNGAIGMTYEQAGNSSAGRAILTSAGDTLTLRDRIAHHLATSRSTIEMASQNAAALIENFRQHFRRSREEPPGKYKTFIISSKNDPNKINELTRLLDLHQISYGLANEIRSVPKAFDYLSGKEGAMEIAASDLVISAYQHHGVFLQALFEPSSFLSDSLTYDITAWALPMAHGLRAWALTEKIVPKRPFVPFKAQEVRLAAPPYAWVIHRRSIYDIAFVAELANAGIRIRTALRDFAMADQQFEAGAYVITRADNPLMLAEFDSLIKAAGARNNIQLHPIFSGFASKGNDLGSESFAITKTPNVAVFYGDEVDDNAYGHIWYIFENEFNYPINPVPVNRIHRLRLSDYNVIIMPSGNYNLSDASLKSLQEWVRQGGRLIALGGAVRGLAGKDGFGIQVKSESKKDTGSTQPILYQVRERDRISDQTPGAVITATVDTTHPLGAGLGKVYHSLKTISDIYELTSANPVIWIPSSYIHQGFIGHRLKPKLAMSPVAAVQNTGEGQIIYFVDDPSFRAFWNQGKFLLGNAVFN